MGTETEAPKLLAIKILNWERYNPRSDIQKPSWFRMEHSLFENPEFFDFTPQELLAWVYLLSMAAKKASASVLINYAHADRLGRLGPATLDSALRKLQRNSCVEIETEQIRNVDERARNVDVTSAAATRRTNETNGTKDRRRTEKIPSEAIPELRGDPEVERLLCGVPQSSQKRWLKLYPDAVWVRSELLKAMDYWENDRKKKDINWPRALGNWLSRGWKWRNEKLNGKAHAEPKGHAGPLSSTPIDPRTVYD